MASTRSLQQVARRLALRPTTSLATSRFASPAAYLLQVRNASVSSSKAKSTPIDDSMQILVAQRLSRPVAPHLTIYKPQLTWILSGLNRVTSILLSGPLYLFAIAYLAAPAFGWSLTSATLAAGFAKWPFALKVAAKAIAALPFTFHSIQGLRHLAWDTGRQLTNLQVIRTGQAAIGLTAVLTLALAFFV